jgi:DHA1 family tetracycline resistance protein-like MFS transporter
VAAGLAGANLIAAAVALPESRPGTRAAAGARPSRAALLRRALGAPGLGPLVTLSFVGTFAFVGMESTFALLGDRRFGYSTAEVGLLFVLIGVASAASQGLLVGRLVRRYGEERVLVAGLAGTAVGLALLAASGTLGALLAALVVLAVASGLVFATVTALTSLAAGDHEQGGALGLVASCGGLARIGGPVVATLLFQHAGVASPLVLGAVLFAGCAVLALTSLDRPAGALRPPGLQGRSPL